jgi:alpha,alpha-trehalase
MQQEIYELNPLFQDVQMQQVFEDGKTFVDCLPKIATGEILERYLQEKDRPGFNLKEFVLTWFEMPHVFASDFRADILKNATEHIQHLWPLLTRQPGKTEGSLIALPHPYVVPGGRFGEIYYWDSYFTMLGLKAAGLNGLLENMVDNFSYLLLTVGYIPNGNRTYFLGRSQPPFFALMVQLLASVKGRHILPAFLPALKTEYQFWMKGATALDTNTSAANHVVKLRDGELLNRYWDEHDTARPESYREDVELCQQSTQAAAQLFRHLRAGAESGWDYSSRWFKDGKNFATIHTTSIIAVDLNCLLYSLENTIAEAFAESGSKHESLAYNLLAEKRKFAVQKYCWSNEANFFVDYDWEENSQKRALTLAGIVPLFCKIATQQQAAKLAAILEQQFLKPGGLVTTLEVTGQQWDAPNGWAPLQWMAITGLQNYGQQTLAKEVAKRWLALNDKVYAATGKMMEKYNVEDLSKEAGGGEYNSQDGFGWTNGVYLALKELVG